MKLKLILQPSGGAALLRKRRGPHLVPSKGVGAGVGECAPGAEPRAHQCLRVLLDRRLCDGDRGPVRGPSQQYRLRTAGQGGL